MQELAGKTFCCSCEPADCHGHVLQNLYRILTSRKAVSMQGSKKKEPSRTEEISTKAAEKDESEVPPPPAPVTDSEREEFQTELEKLRAQLRNQKKSKSQTRRSKSTCPMLTIFSRITQKIRTVRYAANAKYNIKHVDLKEQYP